MLQDFLLKYFTPAELSLLKVFLVGWIIVELRTRKKFGGLEKLVNKLDQGLVILQTSFSSMQKTLEALIKKIAEVETSDSKSTQEVKERVERLASSISKNDNYLHRVANRTTIVEVKLGIIPPQDETTQEKQP